MATAGVPDDSVAGQDSRKQRRRTKRRSVLGLARLRKLASGLIPETLYPWDEYGVAVLRGEITVCELTYRAVWRHYDDLKRGHERGLYFSPPHAAHVIEFFPRYLIHVEGPKGGTPFYLDPWQQFWTALLFGWRNSDGSRRFRIGYIEVARKNGKSTWMAGIGIYATRFDREPGANVHSVATKKEQALEIYSPAALMVKKSPALSKVFKVFDSNKRIESLDGSCVFSPLSSDEDTMDGLNPSMSLIDELHAHKSRGVWDVIRSARGARRHALMLAITTAGFILYGICTEQRGYLVSILKGEVEDDAYFGVIYTLDDKEIEDPKGWRKESAWIKANPGLGKSKTLDYMRAEAKSAAEIPAQLNNFKTKELNIWVNQASAWFDIADWDKGSKRFDVEKLRGRECYGALDLASTTDLAAFPLVFPPIPDDPFWYVLVWCFVPKDNIEIREKRHKVEYRAWVEQGMLIATDGNVTDYEVIRGKVNEVAAIYDIKEIGFDPWNATHLVNQLHDDGRTMVKMGQNFGNLSAPSKRLEELVLSARLRHGGHPVLRWCAGNVMLLKDSNGNYRPDKGKSAEKIDAVVALIMAIGRAMANTNDDTVQQGFVEL